MTTAIAEIPTFGEAPDAPMKCPDEGLHPNTSEETYRAWDACNNSALNKLAAYSPMHVRYERDHPRPMTEALKAGQVIHTSILEPDQFEKRFIVASQCCATVKSTGNRCENQGIVGGGTTWYCGTHKKQAEGLEPDSRIIIPQSQYDAARIIGERVRAHPFANAMIFGNGHNEVAGVVDRDVDLAKDGVYTLRCKFKVDMLRPEFEAMGDIKTTECARRDEFAKSIYSYGYHRQAAFYTDACELLGKPVKHFAFIVFEKNPPYGVAVYRLRQEDMDLGRAELEKLMRQYAACERLNHWYGYGAEFEDISVMPWDMKRAIDRLAENA